MTAPWCAWPWVSTPTTTRVRFLVRLGMLVSPFHSRHEPGPAGTGREPLLSLTPHVVILLDLALQACGRLARLIARATTGRPCQPRRR